MSTVAQPRPCAYNSLATQGGVPAADPYGLVPMLMDGALDRIARARERLEGGELPEMSRLVRSAGQIVDELRNNLDLSSADAYAANLREVYDYVCRRLVSASAHGQVATLDEVSNLLREIRSAWVMYV